MATEPEEGVLAACRQAKAERTTKQHRAWPPAPPLPQFPDDMAFGSADEAMATWGCILPPAAAWFLARGLDFAADLQLDPDTPVPSDAHGAAVDLCRTLAAAVGGVELGGEGAWRPWVNTTDPELVLRFADEQDDEGAERLADCLRGTFGRACAVRPDGDALVATGAPFARCLFASAVAIDLPRP